MVKRLEIRGLSERDIQNLKYLAKKFHAASTNQFILSQLNTVIKVGGLDILDSKLAKHIEKVYKIQLSISDKLDDKLKENELILAELERTQQILEGWIDFVAQQAAIDNEEG